MSWIKTINFHDADLRLKKIYNKITGPSNNVDNVLKIHSLRPHTLVGHMTLYKNVLHNSNNTLPKWYLEAIGVYISDLNSCDYCVEHHFAGLVKILNDEDKSNKFKEAVKNADLENYFDTKFFQGCLYAKKLTINYSRISEIDIIKLRKVGFTDGEILELNQVVSYFNYVNRTVIGLGVNIKGDILGLSPSNSDNPNNWNHS